MAGTLVDTSTTGMKALSGGLMSAGGAF